MPYWVVIYVVFFVMHKTFLDSLHATILAQFIHPLFVGCTIHPYLLHVSCIGLPKLLVVSIVVPVGLPRCSLGLVHPP